MKTELKILAGWILSMTILRLFLTYTDATIQPLPFINTSTQILLCILSIVIAIRSKRNQRYVFINFAILFGFVLPQLASTLVGQYFWKGNIYSSLLYRIYINYAGTEFILLGVLLFTMVEYFFPLVSNSLKYAGTIVLSLVIVFFIFQPFILTPFALYSTQDLISLNRISKAHDGFVKDFGKEPDDHDLVLRLEEGTNRDATQEAKTTDLVHRLRPFLKEGGAATIFWKPLEMRKIALDCIVIILIIGFLTNFYFSNKGFHAYLDKILIIQLLLSSIEILHEYGFTQSHSFLGYLTLFDMGQFFTVLIYVIMIYAFDRKLTFILSPAGRYYETVLVQSPLSITRWRDEIDSFIIKAFSQNRRRLKELGVIETTQQHIKERAE